MRNADHVVKQKDRKTFAVPLTSGDYAAERITFGAVSTGLAEQSFMGVTALIESGPTGAAGPSGAVVELWLPKVADSTEGKASFDDADYHYAGLVVASPRTAVVSAVSTGATVSYGSATWPLAGYPGAQLRVRSGGVAGSLVVSGTAF